MSEAFLEELTRADISLIAASFYEGQPRIWLDDGWVCPQCRRTNEKNVPQCQCAISRDGLPEFGTPLLIRCRESNFLPAHDLYMALDNDSPQILEDPGESPALIEALAIIFLPAVLFWVGVVELIVKVWRSV
jgi:hypothetical protein